MTPEQLKERIETLGPGTDAQVMDLTGTQDHYRVIIVSSAFEGKRTMQQHRLVFDLLDAELKSEEVHALTLKTLTPDEYAKLS